MSNPGYRQIRPAWPSSLNGWGAIVRLRVITEPDEDVAACLWIQGYALDRR